MRKIAVFIGTRPDTLKLIPVVRTIKKNKLPIDVIATGQHTTLLSKVLKEFNINTDISFNIKRNDLNEFSGKLLLKLSGILTNYTLAIVQGDTTTSMIAGLACFYSGIPVFHIEAGLRSGNMYDPYPEEVNRRIITQIAEHNFAPTDISRDNLLKEGVKKSKISITGNTIIDLVSDISKSMKNKEKNILITLHRRENWGEKMQGIFKAIKELSKEYGKYNFIFPVHPNPIVADMAFKIFQNSSVKTIKPKNYRQFIKLMMESKLILTDSGGVQEEASFLGKPLIVLRNTTERPEVINNQVGVLAGTKPDNIIKIVSGILDDENSYSRMKKRLFCYGNGKSAEKIFAVIEKRYNVKKDNK